MSPKIHIRRCHVCGEVNEADEKLVQKCEHCGKTLAPFYYFDESKLMGLDQSPQREISSKLPLKQYPPLWGLTAYWEKIHEGGNN